MTTRNCTIEQNSDSAKKAKQAGFKESFAPVMIAIESIESDIVHFTAKGSRDDVTTHWRVPELWPDCPTLFVPTNGFPTVGDESISYLGETTWNKLAPAAQKLSPGLKWPERMGLRWAAFSHDELARKTPLELAFETLGFDATLREQSFEKLPLSPAYKPLPLSVTSVRIQAAVKPSGTVYAELLEADAPRQVLDLRKVYTTLQIKNPETGKYAPVRLQVLRADLHGRNPRNKREATIDLLDPTLADAYQLADLTATPVTVRLSQKGFSKFAEGWHP